MNPIPPPTHNIFGYYTPEQIDQKLADDARAFTAKPADPPPAIHYYIKTKYTDLFNDVPNHSVKKILENEYGPSADTHDYGAIAYNPIPGTMAKGFGWNLASGGLLVGVWGDNNRLIQSHNELARKFDPRLGGLGGTKNKKKHGCRTKRRKTSRRSTGKK
jgi:hypothetical protein